ncbi:hypothetical protein LAZ67_12001915 [Cordylochernes scorpioides]|uniref:Transposase n=1 Tax=Cordylochernes scorpioides TaxID=51811 RepID=A0ABY6L285_9ARAC|nr:hypothetical protein LAZ67_12001915 [Cordylochernes scorpioides]
MFSEGRVDVKDEERAGCPSTSTTDEKINEVEKIILANRRITVREVAEDLNISIGSCHSIFINDLGMRRVAAKFVPKLLNCDQKQHRMNIANEMLDSVFDDLNLLQRVITGDEAWVYGYDVETKAQSSQWKLPHEPRPKKACQVRSNVKVLLTVFFDCRGVVHHEFLPQGRTVREFKNGRTDVHDEPRAGRPSVSDETIAKVEAAMLEYRRVTGRKLCDLVPDVSKATIDKILHENLGYSKVCARWVPKMLTEDHKWQRVEAAQKFLDCHETDGEEFLDSIVTGDETWVHYTTPEIKEQSCSGSTLLRRNF